MFGLDAFHEDTGYCVYLHRRKDNDEIIYVGEGRLSRARNVNYDKCKNKQHGVIVKEVGIYYEVYADGLTKNQAENLEAELISSLRSKGHPITNRSLRATAGRECKREDFEDCLYVDPSSTSGLRWKVDRYNIPGGYKLAVKDSIAGCKTPSGYWTVLTRPTHRIVYALVHGVCPAGLTIDHIDCNKDNNSIENLRLMTRNENSSRGNIHFVAATGEDVATAKITNEQCLEMYKMFEQYKTNTEIAEVFGLHERYVSLVRHGRRWCKMYKEYGKVFPESFTENVTSHEQVKEALILFEHGLNNKQISDKTGIERSVVSRLRSGKALQRLVRQIKSEVPDP